MRRTPIERAIYRRVRFEWIEERLVFSTLPVLEGFLPDTVEVTQPALDWTATAPDPGQIVPLSGVQYVHDTYGLDGGGQTVAVIDSGIAYDHVALGAGFGTGYRVVGGADFTEENDLDPYDDRPAGFHGTHVAGIIASDDENHTGLAPNVDLVALRVFNDMGIGQFSWVEDALQWVHLHQDDFRYPITTVNLSLGCDWNGTGPPPTARLEDEFATLFQDGIFVSVAAGNSFEKFGEPGLSYPAASPYVVAVSSTDNQGQLSDFSQRYSRALAAPGERILSTVPDAFAGSDGYANDWMIASGTSMAAPFVAGASILVREAMEMVGYESIDQTAIYAHLRATADTCFDTVTGITCYSVNLERAIDELLSAASPRTDQPDPSELGIRIDGANVFVEGTAAADLYEVFASEQTTITVRGLSYTLSEGTRWRIQLAGNSGNDSLTIHCAQDCSLALRPWRTKLSSSRLVLKASGFESVSAIAEDGIDSVARLHGSKRNETLTVRAHETESTGVSFSHRAVGFDRVFALAKSGNNDVAHFYGSAEESLYQGRSGYRILRGTDHFNKAFGFDRYYFHSDTGTDPATLGDATAPYTIVGLLDSSHVNSMLDIRQTNGVAEDDQMCSSSSKNGLTDACLMSDRIGVEQSGDSASLSGHDVHSSTNQFEHLATESLLSQLDSDYQAVIDLIFEAW